jgi:galactoside O-acetyltransferase
MKNSIKQNFYRTENVIIENNVKIDDFCILSGKITLRTNTNISAKGALCVDCTGMFPYGFIYNETDIFSGVYLIGSIYSDEKASVEGREVIIERFCQIGRQYIVLCRVA